MKIEIHYYYHHAIDDSKLTLILRQLKAQELLLNKIIMDNKEYQVKIKEKLDQVDNATTQIAEGITEVGARIDRLTKIVEEQDIPQEAKDAILSEISGTAEHLSAQAASLKAMGKDPENPVPVPAPVPM